MPKVILFSSNIESIVLRRVNKNFHVSNVISGTMSWNVEKISNMCWQGGRKLILDGEARVNMKNEILQKIVKFQHFYTKKS